MKISATPHKILIPLLSLTLMTVSALRAQDQDGSTNAPQGTNSCPNKSGWHHGHGGSGWANLTKEEREELKADFAKIKEDPQFVAARQAVKDAQTPEAKQEARKSLRSVREQLLLQTDPSVQPILEKLKAAHKNSGKDESSAPKTN